MQLVRIFLSSPADVAEVRKLARQFIDSELPKFPHFREKVKFELIAWDDPAGRIPMLASEAPQESVNAARPRPANCDIVIVILWSRMGTPLPDHLRKPNGKPYLSGTEWEYEDAVHSMRHPRPEVLVYRRTAEPLISLRDPKKKEKEEQFERVEAFFDASLKGGINEYATPSEFKTLLSQHLQDVVWRRLQHNFYDAAKVLTDVAKTLWGMKDTLSQAKLDNRKRTAEYIQKVAECIAEISLAFKEDKKPHEACGKLHGYVNMLYDALEDKVPSKELARLREISRYSLNIRGMLFVQSDEGSKEAWIRALDLNAGYFKSIADYLMI